MDLGWVGLTLYDTIGYLLPGCVVLAASSVIEASFMQSDIMALSKSWTHPLPYAIAADFLGLACHAVGSSLARWRPGWFKSGKDLSPTVMGKVREQIREKYKLELSEEDGDDSEELFLLADSMVQTSGVKTEREVLLAREGLFKASMVSYALLLVACLASLFVGGLRIQSTPGVITSCTPGGTVLIAVVLLLLTLLFRHRCAYFMSCRRRYVFMDFLAIVANGRRSAGEATEPRAQRETSTEKPRNRV